VIRVENVHKRYARGAVPVQALAGVSVEIAAGCFAAVMGPSGSGKSTLLHLIGALDRPDEGEVFVDGTAVHALDDDGRTRLRRERVGFVFQFFNLLPTMSAVENVMLPALIGGQARSETEPKARALLERVGLAARADHRPRELSGGEMQRVAIARALLLEAPVLLADEPTGNLDTATGELILDLLRGAASELGRTILMVTHDPRAAERADVLIRMRDGRRVEA